MHLVFSLPSSAPSQYFNPPLDTVKGVSGYAEVAVNHELDVN